jgi:neutral trehalase
MKIINLFVLKPRKSKNRNNTKSYLSIFLLFLTLPVSAFQNITPEKLINWKEQSKDYIQLSEKLKKGWNTWDTRNVLSQVYMPDGFAITLDINIGNIKISGPNLGSVGRNSVEITPGGHSYDGSYTDLTVKLRDRNIRVQTVAKDKNIVILVSNNKPDDSTIISIVPEMKWNRQGNIIRKGSTIQADVAGKTWTVNTTDKPASASPDAVKPQLSVTLKNKLGISTDKTLSVIEIEKMVADAEMKHNAEISKYGDSGQLFDAMQTVLAWNTIYEPINDRVITPVSRSWSGGGFVLFEWDTYFACYMLSMTNKDLAYANLIAITKEITPSGFVPNFTSDKTKSIDRSQPPVGSTVLKEVYRHYKEKWILDLLFQDMLTWNRWWPKSRDIDGYLCWGSDPIPLGPKAPALEKRATGKMLGAKFESGLDDSPMYDNIPFDTIRHMMKLADVGLMSMYIMDCNSLAEIARVLNKLQIEKELLDRAKKYGDKLETLWDEKEGIYLNKNLETGLLDKHLSPTLFYPLQTKVPSLQKAERMMKEHFYNPAEFWGEWMMPTIARNDPAYSNDYWRGRIWGPTNFLVYLGMRNYDIVNARTDMVQKSNQLLLKMWQKSRLVHENYNPFTGEGTSDDFYHWGALLGFMKFIENGTVLGPEKSL